jgi:hypothetical protein
VNTLAFGMATEDNCRMLQSIKKHCLEWARNYRALFASKKYILVHFTNAWTKHNIACPLTLPSFIFTPSPSARDLGVILDKKSATSLTHKHQV